MIPSGEEYRDSLRDGRAVWIDGERVEGVPPVHRPRGAGRRRHVLLFDPCSTGLVVSGLARPERVEIDATAVIPRNREPGSPTG